ncbi:hypothetical protein DXG01_012940, partial [Tephrocybe rancida]
PVPPPRGINELPPMVPAQALTTSTPDAGTITTPSEFLKAIGRSFDTKLEVEHWDAMWRLSGHELKKKGLGDDISHLHRDRYVLWCMEKYRNGLPIESFAHEPRPKKTIRG